MHELVKAGLDIMRDPTTCQATGRLRLVNDDGSECFCAMGCIAEAAVRMGQARWHHDDESDLSTPVAIDAKTDWLSFYEVEELHKLAAYNDAMDELESVGVSYRMFLRMNDKLENSLEDIAHSIEDAYATSEAR